MQQMSDFCPHITSVLIECVLMCSAQQGAPQRPNVMWKKTFGTAGLWKKRKRKTDIEVKWGSNASKLTWVNDALSYFRVLDNDPENFNLAAQKVVFVFFLWLFLKNMFFFTFFPHKFYEQLCNCKHTFKQIYKNQNKQPPQQTNKQKQTSRQKTTTQVQITGPIITMQLYKIKQTKK